MQDYLKIVVTGEVDSGKSTLIGRILYDTGSLSDGVFEEIKNVSERLGSNLEFAYLLDSFEEERKNQLTIDTTQVFCKVKDGRRLVFIDVPGHRELLKNMLSGSSYADMAILVVDAQKSIEEQTKRHFFILKFLGINKIILALNKMDLVNFDKSVFKDFKEKIEFFSAKIGVRPEYFVPLSAKEGENILKKTKKMPWYKGSSLLETIGGYIKKEKDAGFRLPVQDVYDLNENKIAVGEIVSGRIKNGDKVNILPINENRTVKGIRVFKKNKSYAATPESIGLLLNDMNGLIRGQVICKAPLPKVTREISAKIFCVRPLNINQDLRFKCVTQDTPVRIKRITEVWDTVNLEPKSKELLEETDVADVVLITNDPVTVESYKGFNSLGRFVLKNNNEIYAVGIII